MASLPVDDATMRRFRETLKEQGYVLTDGGREQVKMYRGEPKLLDLFAVQRLP